MLASFFHLLFIKDLLSSSGLPLFCLWLVMTKVQQVNKLGPFPNTSSQKLRIFIYQEGIYLIKNTVNC